MNFIKQDDCLFILNTLKAETDYSGTFKKRRIKTNS